MKMGKFSITIKGKEITVILPEPKTEVNYEECKECGKDAPASTIVTPALSPGEFQLVREWFEVSLRAVGYQEESDEN